ncbi:MAG: endonuclease/exonuclease/phosphatase family protein [Bacteroidia bacterium]|nr:endonuclease/exonuclease/phosphatase family protein [Bacteroidia bacterium]
MLRIVPALLLISSMRLLAAYPVHPLRVMSFNIRLNTASDGYNAWPLRLDLVESMIRFHQADLLGVQEALPSQMDDLGRMLPDFERWGAARDTGAWGEYSALWYRRSRLERLAGGTFWLSETPDQMSKGWDAALNRIATWAIFRDRLSGARVLCMNTHFDHRGEEARRQSAWLIRRRIRELNPEGLPVLLLGDFNSNPESEPYRILISPESPGPLVDALNISILPHHGPSSTWSGFSFPGQPGQRIDYLFVQGPVRVLRHGALSESWSGRFPSDHLPVLAEVLLNPVRAWPQSHAHNDYEHPRPLLDALAQGCTSVEADIWLIEGQLCVSHGRPRKADPARTLEQLYLAPLAARIAAHGWVHPADPGVFHLMIDLKHEGEAVWAQLQEVLQPYAWMLEPQAGGQAPLQIFLSGDRPVAALIQSPPPFPVGLDGRPEDLGQGYTARQMPVVSQRYGALFSWQGTGPVPPEDVRTLSGLAAAARAEGKLLRFWASPEEEAVWAWLLDHGAGLINTDQPERLRKFLEQRAAGR